MHVSTSELAKVSKLLFAVDDGSAHQWAGKRMDDIKLDSIPGITTDNESGDDSQDEEETGQILHTGHDNSISSPHTVVPDSRKRKRCVTRDETDSDDETLKKHRNKQSNSNLGRRPWLLKEKQVVFNELHQYIKE